MPSTSASPTSSLDGGPAPVPPGTARLEDVVGDFHSRYRTVGQSVLEILRQSILQGAFEPGQWLRQEELAQRIGVSRAPVRTALMHLETEGLVVFQPHRGAQVRQISRDRLNEIYQLRILLETYALRAAAGSLTPSEKADNVDQAIRLDRSHEGAAFLNDRIAFYRKLYDARHHPVVVEMIEQLRISVGRYRLGKRIEETDFSHERLARAVQDDDLDAAEAMLRTHLAHVCDGIVASLPSGLA